MHSAWVGSGLPPVLTTCWEDVDWRQVKLTILLHYAFGDNLWTYCEYLVNYILYIIYNLSTYSQQIVYIGILSIIDNYFIAKFAYKLNFNLSTFC